MTRRAEQTKGKRERHMPEGEETRGSDFMDYSKPDGGPTRDMIHLGSHETEVEEEPEEQD